VVAAEHRQYEMAVSKWMVVEDQCLVVDDGHGHMVADMKIRTAER